MTSVVLTKVTPALIATKVQETDRERDRRMEEGFEFEGVVYQCRAKDIVNISGAVTAATLSLMNGVSPTELRWANPDADFTWIAADNSTHPMELGTVINFGKTAMACVERLTFRARYIKDQILMGNIPLDITDDSLWD